MRHRGRPPRRGFFLVVARRPHLLRGRPKAQRRAPKLILVILVVILVNKGRVTANLTGLR